MTDRFNVGLYNKKLLDGNEDVEPGVIDFLAMLTRDFVSDVICGASILLEEQRRMKGSLRVWHQEEVNIALLF